MYPGQQRMQQQGGQPRVIVMNPAGGQQQQQQPQQGQPVQYVQQGQPQYAPQQQMIGQQPQVQYVQQAPPQQGQFAQPQVQYVQQGQQPVQYVQQPQQGQPVQYVQQGQPQQQVQYVQQGQQPQPQYVQQQGQQPQYIQQQQPMQGQPMQPMQQQPVQYMQQQPMQGQPMQPMQQQQVQYAQQPMQGQQVQYAQQPMQQQPMQPQQVQYAQPVQPAQGGVYQQNVVKNAGPPPPSFQAHQQKKNIYEMAEEKANSSNSGNPMAGGGGANWSQPRPDARGTDTALQNFNDDVALEKARGLYKAMKGLGANKSAMVEITGRLNQAQRLRVRQKFETVVDTKKSLIKWLKSELSGNTEDVFLGCYRTQGENDARIVKKSLDGMGYDTDLLCEVLCTRTWEQLCNLRKAWVLCDYRKAGDCRDRQDGQYLTGGVVKAVEDETKKIMGSGNFQSLMVTLLTRQRPPNSKPNEDQVHDDAEVLNRYIKQEKKDSTKMKFVEIYTQRSWAHLAALSEKFSDVSKKYTLVAAIGKAFGEGSDTSHALKVLTSFASQPYDFWAKKLRDSMKGMGTNDSSLVRIILTRFEIDMQNIKTVFGQRYGNGKTLKNWIQDDVSGHYQKMLLHLTGYVE